MEKQGEDYNLVDWYLDVLRKYKDNLFGITRHVVADAWFSKANFVNEACLLGFHVISRLRDDAALWYSHDGVCTGKRGRPRVKGEKTDFGKLDLRRCEKLDIEGERAYSIKAYSKAMKRNIKVVVHYPESGSALFMHLAENFIPLWKDMAINEYLGKNPKGNIRLKPLVMLMKVSRKS